MNKQQNKIVVGAVVGTGTTSLEDIKRLPQSDFISVEDCPELRLTDVEVNLCVSKQQGKGRLMERDQIEVHIRANTGEDSQQEAETFDAALCLAQEARVTTNHMVCIEVNGERVQRWDRDRVEGENHWGEVDPDEMEVLGQIRVVRRA